MFVFAFADFHLVLVGLLSFLGFFEFVYIAFINNCVWSGSKIGLVSLIVFLDLFCYFCSWGFLEFGGFLASWKFLLF